MRIKGSSSLTTEQIAKAKNLSAQGRSLRYIARQLKRSVHCIKKALSSPEVVAEVTALKADLADLYESLTLRTLESIGMDTIEDASLQQRAVSAGIFTDKFRLLRDQSTSNLAVQVGILLDAARLFRDKSDEETEEYTREWREQQALPGPEPPAIHIPEGKEVRKPDKTAAVSRVASPPTPDPAPTVSRVRYHTPVEPIREEEYSPLTHGLPHSR